MPKLSLSRRHRRCPDLTSMQTTSVCCCSHPPTLLEKKAPRLVSEEDVRQSQEEENGSLATLRSSSSSSSSSMSSQEQVLPTTTTTSSSSSIEEGELTPRKRGLLKRPSPCVCLVELATTATTTAATSTAEEMMTTSTPLLPMSSRGSSSYVSSPPPSPWGHFVDMLVPHDHVDGEQHHHHHHHHQHVTAATGDESIANSSSSSSSLFRRTERGFVPSCPMPLPPTAVSTLSSARVVPKHEPYPFNAFRQRKRLRIHSPHTLAQVQPRTVEAETSLSSSSTDLFPGLVLTYPTPLPPRRAAKSFQLAPQPQQQEDVWMLEETQLALQDLNVD